jgi:ankyrin repeat protein
MSSLDQIKVVAFQGNTEADWRALFRNSNMWIAWIDDADNVNEVRDGMTMLHVVALYGSVSVMEALVHRGADIRRTDGEGRNALFGAALDGCIAKMQWLVEHGLSVEAVDTFGRTVLHHAAAEGHIHVMKWLMARGLRAATWRQMVESVDEDGADALMYAAGRGEVATIEWLVEQGLIVKTASGGDRPSLLHHAASKGHTDMMEWLVAKGVSIAAVDEDGGTALHYAATEGNTACVAWLLKKGVDMAAVCVDGRTAFHHAVENGHATAAHVLLRHVKDDRTLRAFTDGDHSPTAETEPFVTKARFVRDERQQKLEEVSEQLAKHAVHRGNTKLFPGDPEMLARANKSVEDVLEQLPADVMALEMSGVIKSLLEQSSKEAVAMLLKEEEGTRAGSQSKPSKRKKKTKPRKKAKAKAAASARAKVESKADVEVEAKADVEAEAKGGESTSFNTKVQGGSSIDPLQGRDPQQVLLIDCTQVQGQRQAADCGFERVCALNAALEESQKDKARLTEWIYSLEQSLDRANTDIQRLAMANTNLVNEAVALKQELSTANEQAEVMLAKFEVLEEMYQPVQTQNEERKWMLANTRKAALEIGRTRQDLRLPTKRMGELDSVKLYKLGVAVEGTSLLQGIVCDPNFHPWHVQHRQGSRSNELEEVVNWQDQQLKKIMQMHDDDGREGRGQQVAEEVLRCNKEVQQWNPSGGYCVVIPYHHGEKRELRPEELLKIAAGIDVPGCRLASADLGAPHLRSGGWMPVGTPAAVTITCASPWLQAASAGGQQRRAVRSRSRLATS